MQSLLIVFLLRGKRQTTNRLLCQTHKSLVVYTAIEHVTLRSQNVRKFYSETKFQTMHLQEQIQKFFLTKSLRC